MEKQWEAQLLPGWGEPFIPDMQRAGSSAPRTGSSQEWGVFSEAFGHWLMRRAALLGLPPNIWGKPHLHINSFRGRLCSTPGALLDTHLFLKDPSPSLGALKDQAGVEISRAARHPAPQAASLCQQNR